MRSPELMRSNQRPAPRRADSIFSSLARDVLRIRHPLLCSLRGWRVRGCWVGGEQVGSGHLAGSQRLNLQGFGQAHATGAVDPVVHLALADRRAHTPPKGRLGDLVLLEVVFESHNHIMVYFNVC